MLSSVFRVTAPLICCVVFAQSPAPAPKPDPDILIFNDGEKLIGQLEKATGSSVTFKSDMAGEITVDWSKVKEVDSSRKFAVIPKTVTLRTHEEHPKVPQGTLAMNDQKIEVKASSQSQPQTVPVADVGHVVDQPTFESGIRGPGLLQGWKGGATVGVSLTQATQNSRTFTSAVNMVRADPTEDWLELRSRTILNYNQSYGKLTTPGAPTAKTSIIHFDAEEDKYFSPRFFGFVNAALDHNFSQGLSLEQAYGAGFGAVAYKSSNQEFDVRASVNYVDQRFSASAADQNLIGSVFSETYLQKFAHGILLNEQGSITPAWNNLNAYSATGTVGLTFPVYHRLGFTAGALDNFLNDPPAGFRKNSFQFTLGATYAFQ